MLSTFMLAAMFLVPFGVLLYFFFVDSKEEKTKENPEEKLVIKGYIHMDAFRHGIKFIENAEWSEDYLPVVREACCIEDVPVTVTIKLESGE